MSERKVFQGFEHHVVKGEEHVCKVRLMEEPVTDVMMYEVELVYAETGHHKIVTLPCENFDIAFFLYNHLVKGFIKGEYFGIDFSEHGRLVPVTPETWNVHVVGRIRKIIKRNKNCELCDGWLAERGGGSTEKMNIVVTVEEWNTLKSLIGEE